MNNLLSPEKNNFLLRKYHTSGKLLIPFILPSIICHKFNYTNMSKAFDTLNVLNIGYHSYVSTSCIITDYIKPKNLSNFCRILSLKSHSIASFGLLYYIFKRK